ncbi:flagellar hook-length control protein FliK [Pseudomonas sp. KU26590]|uniref:flagellar hook-length control protein FliK n=1 Tax=Pseudomonas sp. KU26590 TaxID=2991051 RepID=UPI00223D6FFD|nr:flagellar hook-length control protein FliK [Pseudomonas sp. KU26590]UZJ62085.1 flagellar hook-length control protein FliK [Pseudomonas sp. KU26590]
MALANNPLLTALTAAKVQKAGNTSPAKAPDPVKHNTSSFSDVFAKQAPVKSQSADNPAPKPTSAKSSAADDKPAASHTSAADDKAVADNGNGLPAKPVNGKADDEAGAGKGQADDKDDASDTTQDPTVADAPAVDPLLDPTLAVTPPVQEPVAVAPPVDPVVDPALLAGALPVMPPPAVQAPTQATAATDATYAAGDGFDPSADPLEGLTAVQVALENKAQQTAQNNGVHGDGKGGGKQDPNADPSQLLATNLAALGDQPVDKSTTEGGGDKAFSGLLADGLKDVKGATSDTRVDNFADRLAALSQAVQVKNTPASAPATPLLNQPLAMNQGGWTEGVVNRVMYLSSQNLKQADIQLEPAELGRLDIRVNMAADQQTQVTFMSAHVGVREALESQMSRLRDSFVQQGMGQVNVNVSDQSQGWQQQAQQQSGGDGQRNGGSSRVNGAGGSDLIADGAPVDAASAAANASLTVVGSSAVDYYA